MKKIITIITMLFMHQNIIPSELPKSSLMPTQQAIATSSPVRLISITPRAEETMGYIARVSNPANQENPNYANLLNYCLKNEHWSVFEQAHMTLEVETSLAIATQILRHRSFTFQQFSQRYADPSVLAPTIFIPKMRKQDLKNRQNSLDVLTEEEQAYWREKINNLNEQTINLYKEMLDKGIAKESARFILPQATTTRLYMTGPIRSWITYLKTRLNIDTQKEHRDIAQHCQRIFIDELPITAEALGWKPPVQAPNDSKTL